MVHSMLPDQLDRYSSIIIQSLLLLHRIGCRYITSCNEVLITLICIVTMCSAR